MFFALRSVQTLLVFSLLTVSSLAWAKDENARPLHIKISSGKEAASGIRIHKGQVPVAPPKKEVVKHEEMNNHVPPAPSVEDAVESCEVARPSPLGANRIQNMADSLKAYLRAEKRDPMLIDTLLQAARETNTDFELLIVKAMLESDLGRLTKSPTSTARGIFQYIESTWLVLMLRYGERIGYPHYANAIEINDKTGQPQIKNTSPFSRQDILAQRFNPYMAAMIKAYQIKDESNVVEEFKDGGRLSATDHYIAHMMGLKMAEEFYRLKKEESSMILAFSPNPLFREAAYLNPAFFYDTQHKALTAGEAYQNFKRRISNTYERLRKIEIEYGTDKNISAIPCSDGSMPALRAADIEKPDILPAKGLSFAAAAPAMIKMPN